MGAMKNLAITLEDLHKALLWVDSLEAADLQRKYIERCYSCGPNSWCALRIDPLAESVYTWVDCSPCFDLSELEHTYGPLSRRTIKSGQGYPRPGPDDGCKWHYCQREDADYFHVFGKSESWELIQNVGDYEGRKLEFFFVSTTPVEVKEDPALQDALDQLVRDIEIQILELENAAA